MRRMIFACTVLLALSTNSHASQIFKWVDGQGNVHFGSQPPEGRPATAVNPHVSQPKIEPPKPVQAEQEDKTQEKFDHEARQKAAKQERERKDYCERIRKDLAQMKANPRVRVEDGGEMRRITEEERQQRMTKSEAAIKENCR